MKTSKIEALEAFITDLEISENELTDWFNSRGKDKSGLIPTKLPLVYRKGNEITVEKGLDLNRKDELWGIQLLSGVMVALQCGAGYNVIATTWGQVKEFAQTMRFNDKPGILPSKNVLKEYWGEVEKAKFAATVNVLKENEIAADGYRGCLWCSEEYFPDYAYFFGLNYGGYGWYSKYDPTTRDRVALAF